MERVRNPVTLRVLSCSLGLLLICGCTPQHRVPGTGKQAKAKALAVASPSPSPAPDADFPPTPMPGTEIAAKWTFRGVTLLPENGSPYGTKEACEKVETAGPLLDLNSIAVRQYVLMNNWDQPDLYENPAVAEKDIQNQIAVNTKLGLKTAFILGTTVNVTASAQAGGGCGNGTWVPWHGIVDFDGKANYDKWFSAYETVLAKYLKVAADSGQVSLFGIGNELSSLTTTLKLKDQAGIQKYLGNLNYFLNSQDSKMRDYAKTVVNHLLDFEGSNFKEAAELRNWAATGRGGNKDGSLTSNATKRLVTVENDRRSYLLSKWYDVISDLKKSLGAYPDAQRPLLSYNVNFDGYDQVEFWPSLDRMSVSAYFPLADYNSSGVPVAQNDISADYLKTKLSNALAGLGKFAVNSKTKVIFSELGYTNRKYTTLHPWAFSGCEMVVLPGQSTGTLVNDDAEPLSNQERTNAIDALQELSDAGQMPWLDGVFLWNLYASDNLNDGDPYTLFASSQATGNDTYERAIAALFKSASQHVSTDTIPPMAVDPSTTASSSAGKDAKTGHGKAAAAAPAPVSAPSSSLCN